MPDIALTINFDKPSDNIINLVKSLETARVITREEIEHVVITDFTHQPNSRTIKNNKKRKYA